MVAGSPIGGVARRRGVLGRRWRNPLIDALSYFIVQLTPTVLVIGLAWTVFRAIGVSVVWKRDE